MPAGRRGSAITLAACVVSLIFVQAAYTVPLDDGIPVRPYLEAAWNKYLGLNVSEERIVIFDGLMGTAWQASGDQFVGMNLAWQQPYVYGFRGSTKEWYQTLLAVTEVRISNANCTLEAWNHIQSIQKSIRSPVWTKSPTYNEWELNFDNGKYRDNISFNFTFYDNRKNLQQWSFSYDSLARVTTTPGSWLDWGALWTLRDVWVNWGSGDRHRSSTVFFDPDKGLFNCYVSGFIVTTNPRSHGEITGPDGHLSSNSSYPERWDMGIVTGAIIRRIPFPAKCL